MQSLSCRGRGVPTIRALAHAALFSCSLVLLSATASGQAGIRYYGTSCGPQLSVEFVKIGSSMQLDLNLTRAPIGRVAFYVIGATRLDLPIPKAPCRLYASPDIVFGFQSSANNFARYSLGAARPGQFYVQALVFTGTASSPSFLATRGVRAEPMLAKLKSGILKENFASTLFRDTTADGTRWSPGSVAPGKVGASGILGDFDLSVVATKMNKKDALGREIWEWDTTSTTIPATHTLTGKPIVVSNGRYEFRSFLLPLQAHVVLKGQACEIAVSGTCEVRGVLDASAPPVPIVNPGKTKGPDRGQAASPGGPGGGKGGGGGDKPFLISTTIGAINGRDGEAARLLPGHPLAAALAKSGGRGSQANPAGSAAIKTLKAYEGLVRFSAYASQICQSISAGGGGGAYASGGGSGWAYDSKSGFAGTPQAYDFGAPAPGGLGADPSKLAFGNAMATRSLLRIGGAGGGGGGSQPIGAIRGLSLTFSSGASGGGGGGILQLRATRFLLQRTAELLSDGGSCPFTILNASLPFGASPGGGGSGGTILIQSDAVPSLLGVIAARGGKGGELNNSKTYSMRPRSRGGDGSVGYYRAESSFALSSSVIRNGIPQPGPANVGSIGSKDIDNSALLSTKWYRLSNTSAGIGYRSYLIRATVGTKTLTYSDDPFLASKTASPGEPIVVHIQGTVLDTSGTPSPGTTTPWQEGDGTPLATHKINALRLSIQLVRPSSSPIHLNATEVHYRR